MSHNLPKLSTIRSAILEASQRPTAFPLGALRNSETLATIRTASHLQAFLSEMRAEAERAKSSPLENLSFDLFQQFELTGERVPFERLYFDRRRRLLGLALTSLVDEIDAYLPALCKLIWEICNEYTWSLPAHLPLGINGVKSFRLPPEQIVDLFAAETAQTLAEVMSLLNERLPEWLHYRIRNDIERRIFQPIFHTPQHFEWESASMNWAAVCGGCVGMAALILEDNRERLVGMIDRVVRTMESFLEGFGEDGGCPEGIGYWVYGFGYYSYFAEALKSFTAGKLDLLQAETIQRIAAFPQAISLGDSKFVNYSDAPESAVIHAGLASYLRNTLQSPIAAINPPDFHADHIYRWAHIVRDLVWTKADLLGISETDGSYYLSEIAWLIERRSYKGKMLAFSAKGGHNDEPHNHNDLGHFIIHLAGESLLADLGAGVYTRQYFQDERYSFLQTGSQGHSVPIINGNYQSAGLNRAANVLRYEARPQGSSFSLDLTRAYADDNLLSFTRSFDWSFHSSQASATLTLADKFDSAIAPLRIEECFISLIQPTIEDGLVTWEGRNASITMTYESKQCDALIETIKTKNHYQTPLIVHRLRLMSRNLESSQAFVFSFVCRLAESA